MSSKRPTSPGAEEILGLYFPVLDHGFVSLVDYMGTDECIERAARVSYGYGTRKASQTRGLLRYLRRHLHTTPSEMVELKFHCCMPMFIARQWIRHRTACLAGDSQLVFDLPGANRRGRRQAHKVSLDSFYRMWTEGTTHPMRERLGRMRLRSCDENSGEIIHTNVMDIWQSGEKPVFRVTLEDGRALTMSKDHRCLTEQGWLTLEQATKLRLSPSGSLSWSGDAPRFAVNGVPAYQDRDWLAARRAEGLGVQEIAERAGISTHSIRKCLQKFELTYSAKERSKLSGLSQRGQRRTFSQKRVFTEAHRDAIRRARSGPASNFWKGGSSSERELIGRWTSDNAKRVHERFGFSCAICGSNKRLHAHHVDPVWHNIERARDLDNLITLCGACHDCLHADNLELALLEAVESSVDLHDFWQGRSKQPRPANASASPWCGGWCART